MAKVSIVKTVMWFYLSRILTTGTEPTLRKSRLRKTKDRSVEGEYRVLKYVLRASHVQMIELGYTALFVSTERISLLKIIWIVAQVIQDRTCGSTITWRNQSIFPTRKSWKDTQVNWISRRSQLHVSFKVSIESIFRKVTRAVGTVWLGTSTGKAQKAMKRPSCQSYAGAEQIFVECIRSFPGKCDKHAER